MDLYHHLEVNKISRNMFLSNITLKHSGKATKSQRNTADGYNENDDAIRGPERIPPADHVQGFQRSLRC